VSVGFRFAIDFCAPGCAVFPILTVFMTRLLRQNFPSTNKPFFGTQLVHFCGGTGRLNPFPRIQPKNFSIGARRWAGFWSRNCSHIRPPTSCAARSLKGLRPRQGVRISNKAFLPAGCSATTNQRLDSRPNAPRKRRAVVNPNSELGCSGQNGPIIGTDGFIGL